MSGSDLAIGVDIGGTKIAAAVVDGEGGVVEELRRPTPGKDADALEDTVVGLVDDLRGRHRARAVGVGIAGFVDAAGEVVMSATHLSLVQHPLRERLAGRIGLPVRVENDGTAAAWAEYRFGAGRGVDPLLVVTVGTGLGGGIVVGGELVRGRFGTAGEVGHIPLVRDGRPCTCGDRGCLEEYASGRALIREARAFVRDFAGASHGLVARCGGDPAALEGPMVTAAAAEGDAGALRAFDRIGRALGQGLAAVSNVLDPELIVLGGGVSDAGDLLLGPVREEYPRHVVGTGRRPLAEIVPAELGSRAGAVGAADLARP